MRYRIVRIIIVFFVSVLVAFSQNYNFRHYDIEDGLCHRFIYTIHQDNDGYMWLGTGEGLCRFDGIKFSSLIKGDSISSAYVTCSYKDGQGGVWFGHNDGSISFLKNGIFHRINATSYFKSKVNAITGDDQNTIYAISQNEGIIKINQQHEIQFISTGLNNKLLYSLALYNKNHLLLGTNDGLFFGNINDSTILVNKTDGFPSTKVTCIIPSKTKDGFWIGTSMDGLFLVRNTNTKQIEVKNVGKTFNLENVNIQYLTHDRHHNLWIATFGNGAYKMSYSEKERKYNQIIHYNQNNGLGSQYVKQIFEDKEGNIWFATYGSGLAGLIMKAYEFFDHEDYPLNNNALSIEKNDSIYWVGGEKGLLKIIPQPDGEFNYLLFDKKNGLPEDRVISLYIDKKNTLWAGTEQYGLYKKEQSQKYFTQYFISDNSLANKVTDITGDDSTLYCATHNGVYVFNTKNNERKHYNTLNGLPHNKINDICKKDNNTIYIATKSNGIYTLAGYEAFALESNVQLEFTCLTIDQNGVLWAGTYGDGVFKFTSDSLVNYSKNRGLKSNYCYSIGQDAKGTIWVGHRLGLSRIYFNQKIEHYGPKKGFKGDCNPNAIVSENPLFLIGTNQGMISINSDKEKPNKMPPNTNIISVIINEKPYDPEESIKLPYGSYKVEFEYIGINLTAPQDVTYSYKLEGFDLGWNQAGNNRIAKYSRLDDGNYTFLVKSCNENGICNTEPTTFNLRISIPFWKTWWFILGVITLLILLVILIIAIRERNHRKLQEYLETQLDLRTKEVQRQKKELEIKNKNITDSINYARRIQSGMLPSLSRIHQTVKDAFVFYLPRDIVSGDFFWFNQNKNGEYIIVCSDCTGHGVPGSMLSMIGMTLLKDICNRDNVNTPSDILTHLEKEIQNILNQNEDTHSNDGMDMSIIQFNPKTYKALISSAMQTLIIVKNNELMKIKGLSVPIGGGALIRKRIKKDFKTMEIQLNEKDIIYMFSDGFVDQFGGENEDKFKMRRMMDLIKQIHPKPMDEQKILIEKKFYAWKGDNSQVDDILFMGIRL